MSGDKSIHAIVDANAASNSPFGDAIAQLVQATDISSHTIDDNEVSRKRIKREDLEMFKLQEEIEKTRVNNLHSMQKIQEKRIKNFKDGMEILADINPDWQTDGSFRMQSEEMIKNIIIMPVTAEFAAIAEPERFK